MSSSSFMSMEAIVHGKPDAHSSKSHSSTYNKTQMEQEYINAQLGIYFPPKSKFATFPRSAYSTELLYKMVIVTMRHPESNHKGLGFWKYAEKVYGHDFFDYRGHQGLCEKWITTNRIVILHKKK